MNINLHQAIILTDILDEQVPKLLLNECLYPNLISESWNTSNTIMLFKKDQNYYRNDMNYLQ